MDRTNELDAVQDFRFDDRRLRIRLKLARYGLPPVVRYDIAQPARNQANPSPNALFGGMVIEKGRWDRRFGEQRRGPIMV